MKDIEDHLRVNRQTAQLNRLKREETSKQFRESADPDHKVQPVQALDTAETRKALTRKEEFEHAKRDSETFMVVHEHRKHVFQRDFNKESRGETKIPFTATRRLEQSTSSVRSFVDSRKEFYERRERIRERVTNKEQQNQTRKETYARREWGDDAKKEISIRDKIERNEPDRDY